MAGFQGKAVRCAIKSTYLSEWVDRSETTHVACNAKNCLSLRLFRKIMDAFEPRQSCLKWIWITENYSMRILLLTLTDDPFDPAGVGRFGGTHAFFFDLSRQFVRM